MHSVFWGLVCLALSKNLLVSFYLLREETYIKLCFFVPDVSQQMVNWWFKKPPGDLDFVGFCYEQNCYERGIYSTGFEGPKPPSFVRRVAA